MLINILGYGVTNQAIVRFLNSQKIMCNIYDNKMQSIQQDSFGNNFYSFDNIHTPTRHNLSIISPGIPPNSDFLKHFTNIISEYDFIYHCVDGLFSIWISGTNGKTTTTEMTALMANLVSGGNIGIPLATLLMQENLQTEFLLQKLESLQSYQAVHDITEQDCYKQITFDSSHQVYSVTDFKEANIKWVLETSSFALHYTHFALPNLYILLPLSQDHVSWHGDYLSYISDKLKPLELMNFALSPKKHFVLVPQDLLQYEIASHIIEHCKANVFLYRDSKHLQDFIEKSLCSNTTSKDLKQKLQDYFTLFKEPFKLDFLLSLAGMRFASIDYNLEKIVTYHIGRYRMEERLYHGILFVNDSKATNPHAVLAALYTYKNYAIYLILGGDAKGTKLDMLYPFLHDYKVKVFSIGKDGMAIASECENRGIWVKPCDTMCYAMGEIAREINADKAISYQQTKHSLTQSDDKSLHCFVYPRDYAVMLSPACASLDQYQSYKHRGDEFNVLIEEFFTDMK